MKFCNLEEYSIRYFTGYSSTSRFLISFIRIRYSSSYNATGNFPWLRVLQEISRLGVTPDGVQLRAHHMFLIIKPFGKHTRWLKTSAGGELNGPGGFALITSPKTH